MAQAEFGDDALHQLRKREAEERRSAQAAAQQKVDTNQIPLGQRVKVPAHLPARLRCNPISAVGFRFMSARVTYISAVPKPIDLSRVKAGEDHRLEWLGALPGWY